PKDPSSSGFAPPLGRRERRRHTLATRGSHHASSSPNATSHHGFSRTTMLRITVTTVCLVFATFTGCAHETQEGHPKGTYAATQPMRQAAELSREFVAQIRAIQHIELRAQETGYLEGIFVDEGQAME